MKLITFRFLFTLILLSGIAENVYGQLIVGVDSVSSQGRTYFDFSAQRGSTDSTGLNFLADFRGTPNEGVNFGAEQTLIPGRRYLRYATSGILDTVTNVPLCTNAAPWVTVSWDWPNGTSGMPIKKNELWLVYTREGHYACMQITYVDSLPGGQPGFGTYFKFIYKYQPNGSNNLSGAVPVELKSFSAVTLGKDITLNWSTATEVNNHRFEIERRGGSDQASVFEVIGTVSGNGTTTQPVDYSFTDRNLSAGKYVYRLKQVDHDGSFTYSNTVEAVILTPDLFELAQNYPNPFNPSTNIRFSLGAESKVSLKVYDLLGNEIAGLVNDVKPAGEHSVNFDAAGLPSGYYIYRLTAAGNSLSRSMLLIK